MSVYRGTFSLWDIIMSVYMPLLFQVTLCILGSVAFVLVIIWKSTGIEFYNQHFAQSECILLSTKQTKKMRQIITWPYHKHKTNQSINQTVFRISLSWDNRHWYLVSTDRLCYIYWSFLTGNREQLYLVIQIYNESDILVHVCLIRG